MHFPDLFWTALTTHTTELMHCVRITFQLLSQDLCFVTSERVEIILNLAMRKIQRRIFSWQRPESDVFVSQKHVHESGAHF